MKILASVFSALVIAFCSLHANAQKIKTTSGNPDILKTETTVNIEFVYENISVGKFSKEEDYVKTKTEEYNKKEPGKGDAWAKSWYSDRQSRYEPKFIELFTLTSGMMVNKDAKYTLVFKTKSIEPGYNVAGGMMIGGRKNANIYGDLLIVETANRANSATTITIENVPGGTVFGYDFDTGLRISEAYANAGKKLARYLK